jgi:hypothetical protein
MSGAEFERKDRGKDEREDRSNGDELIPRVSQETRFKLQSELSEAPGSDDHLVATYLERINGVNPVVVEYIAGVARQMPEGLDPTCVAMAGVLVYRLLELEFEQRGKKMPIVQREIADSLIMDIAQEERYFHKLATSLVTENYELLEVLSTFTFSSIVNSSSEREQVSPLVMPLVIASGLGVYALIKAQAEVDRLSRL